MNIKKWFSIDWLLNRKKEEVVTVKNTEAPDNVIFTGSEIIVIKGKNVVNCKANVSKFLEIKDLDDYEKIISILFKEDTLQNKIVVNNVIETYVDEGKDRIPVNIFENDPFFHVSEKGISVKDIPHKVIPTPVLASFVELLENADNNLTTGLELETLKNFTIKLLLSELQESIIHTVAFIKKFGVRLTPKGNLVLFREIKKVGQNDTTLIESISKEWLKIKSWKKSPSAYYLVDSEEGYKSINIDKFKGDKSLVKGILSELYKDLPSMKHNHYTDAHTGRYHIKIGAPYTIKPEDIIKNRDGSCGGALHVASGCKDGYNYKGFGGTPVCVLVDPRNIFRMDTGFSGKIGVKEMFILGVTTRDDTGNFLHLDNSIINDFDEAYNLDISFDFGEIPEESVTNIKNKLVTNYVVNL